MTLIERGDALSLTRALVKVDSRNPSLAPGAPGEGAAARLLADVLTAWGFRVDVIDAAPGRPCVVARIGPAKEGGRSLMFNGHLDVVGVEGMTHAPFDAHETSGRMYGRGSCDMKGGVAAMCAAAARADETGLEGEVIIAAVCDEEWRSIGTSALIDAGIRADAAIVTEPTNLTIAPAHKGFVWVDAIVHGRAAHGSRHDIGVDAIRHAGLLLAELDVLDSELLPAALAHPLLGRASLHASLIEGGVGLSTYPERCTISLERRTLPGESPSVAVREVEAARDRVRLRRPDFRVDIKQGFSQNPSDVATDAPLVRALSASLGACSERVTMEGLSAWTDAALLNDAGIPAICFGPGDIALAHAAEEYVPVDEIERATTVLAHMALSWTSAKEGTWQS
jgi:acetylornithine deacetylase